MSTPLLSLRAVNLLSLGECQDCKANTNGYSSWCDMFSWKGCIGQESTTAHMLGQDTHMITNIRQTNVGTKLKIRSSTSFWDLGVCDICLHRTSY